MTRFIHLTDLHFSDPALKDAHLHSDTAATLEHVTGLIARIDPAPDFVVISGDMTNHGDAASYRALKTALAGIGVPVLHAMGNHDKRDAYRDVFGAGGADPGAPLFHHSRQGGLHVVVLDSSVPGRVGGALGDAQMALAREALDAHPDVPKLIVCHHPPHLPRDGALPWESLSPDDSAALAGLLERRPVAAILCGHVHVDRVLHWNGHPVVISMGLHNTVDPLSPRDMLLAEGAGFAHCTWQDGALDVTFVPVFPRRRNLGRIDHETLSRFS